jgi:hypothetical protein
MPTTVLSKGYKVRAQSAVEQEPHVNRDPSPLIMGSLTSYISGAASGLMRTDSRLLLVIPKIASADGKPSLFGCFVGTHGRGDQPKSLLFLACYSAAAAILCLEVGRPG